MPENPLIKNVIFGLAIVVVGVVMIFVPGFIGMDGFEGGFAISFLSFFVAIIGVVVAALYWNLASILSRIQRGEGLLVHWQYTPDIWQRYTEREYKDQIMDKKGTFIIIAAFALFFGFLFWFLDSEAGSVVFLMMLGLIGLCLFAWQFSALYLRRQNRNGIPEAYISRLGVYMNRRLSTWQYWSARLLGVEFDEKRHMPRLVFTWTAFTYPPNQTYTTRVPVPEGEEETARRIARELNPA